MRCPDGAGVGGKPIVCGKCKELRVPGGGVRIEDDGPGIVIEDRLRYSSDVMEKRDMGVNDIHQGFPGGEEGESIQRMVEHERSLRNHFRSTVERELDLPEIEFGTLPLIGFLGNEHFTVTQFCMPLNYFAFYG